MLKATENNDMHRFLRYSEFIYGKPSKDVFDYTIHSIYDNANADKTSENTALKDSASDLLNVLPQVPRSKT